MHEIRVSQTRGNRVFYALLFGFSAMFLTLCAVVLVMNLPLWTGLLPLVPALVLWFGAIAFFLPFEVFTDGKMIQVHNGLRTKTVQVADIEHIELVDLVIGYQRFRGKHFFKLIDKLGSTRITISGLSISEDKLRALFSSLSIPVIDSKKQST